MSARNFAVVLVLLAAGAFFWLIWLTESDLELERSRCALRWQDSGLQSRYRQSIGCQVEFEPGRWVDESHVKIEPKGKQ